MKKIFFFLVFILFGVNCFSQWTQANNGIANLSLGAKLLASDDTNLYSGTLSGGKMYKSNDNGNNWTEIQPPVTANLPECGFLFNGKYFAGLNASTECIYYTTNNGSSWNVATGSPVATVVRGFYSLSSYIFAYTSNKGIYKSADDGVTWTEANTGLTNLNVVGIERFNNKLYAATIGGGVYTSSDFGGNWSTANNGLSTALNASIIWRLGNSMLYISQDGLSFRSLNDGRSWASWTKPAIMGLSVNEVYRNGINIYIESRHFDGGLRDSIYFSNTDGQQWLNITDNLSATNLNASGITEFNGNLYTAYNISSPGTGIYRRAVILGVKETKIDKLFDIYPNPFTNKIIVANKTNQLIKQLEVLDIQGRTILNSSHFSNNIINTEDLNTGIYLIKITLDDNTIVHRKMSK